jgi:hypothetical protein
VLPAVSSSDQIMAQVIDPLPSDNSDPLLCCYVNATSKIQVARVTNVPDWYFERVVFPGQRLMFEAVPTALLEIHTGMMASSILSDTIPCDRLAVTVEIEPDGGSEQGNEGAISEGSEGNADRFSVAQGAAARAF